MLIKAWKSLAGICKGIKGTVKPLEATDIISYKPEIKVKIVNKDGLTFPNLSQMSYPNIAQ